MAVTQNTYTGNGSTVLYSFTFPYLATTDVKVKLNGSDTTAYSLANATTVQMNSAPANGDKIIIYRNTDNDNKKATFYPGSAIKAEDLNDNYDQILYTVQEVDNNAMSTLGDTAMQGDFLMGSGFGLQFEGATTDDFETRLIATDPTQDNVINLPNASGDLVTTESLTTGGIDTNDNVKIRFGTGNDLEIYHNGSNSYIDNTTGNLYFRGSDGQMLFRPNNNEDALVLKPNGAVELYFNNEKQIETTSLGAAITGSLGIGITTPTFASGNGLHVRGATGGQTRIHLTTNYSGDTASDGFDIAALGAESGSSGGIVNFIQHEAKSVKFSYGSENMIKMVPNGTVELYYDNSKKLHTDSFGVIVSGGLSLDGDLTITSATPIINLTDTNNDSDYQIKNGNGDFNIKDVTNNANRLSINSSGTVDVAGNLDVGAGLDVTGAITGTTNLLIGGASSIFAENNLRFKSSGAAYIDHNTTGQAINFRVSNSSSLDTTPLTIQSDGQVNIGGAQFYQSNNVAIPIDGAEFKLGAGDDLKLYHDGTHSYLDNATGNFHIRGNGADDVKIQAKNGEQSIICHHDGAVELYFDNQIKAQTYASGWSTEHLTLTGNAYLADNKKIFLGDGDDLQLYHDGTNSYILDNGAGHLNLKTNGTQIILTKTPHANLAIFNVDGSNEFYYAGNKKLETKIDGVIVSGRIDPSASDSYGLGQSNLRWANLFMSGDIDLLDSAKLKLGNNDDLQCYHTGSDSRIVNNGSDLYLYTVGDHEVKILADSQNAIICKPDGAVELYFDNEKKLETTDYGVAFVEEAKFDNNTNAGRDVIWDPANDQMRWTDNTSAAFGNGSDLKLYHDATGSYIDEAGTGGLKIRVAGTPDNGFYKYASNEELATFQPDNAVRLFYDGDQKLQTTSGGASVTGNVDCDGIRMGDSDEIRLGVGDDLKLYHDATNSHIVNATGYLLVNSTGGDNVIRSANDVYLQPSGGDFGVKCEAGGSTKIYWDGNEKIETTSWGSQVTGSLAATGNIDVASDTGYLQIGAGYDLKIYHDGTDSYIKNTTGHLKIGDANVRIMNAACNEDMIHAKQGEEVELYYAGNKKLETTTNGVTVTGSVTTQDINMSNLNASSGNEVDGTKGNWTMQEGESDLFLINRISGKKYKFNLTEIN